MRRPVRKTTRRLERKFPADCKDCHMSRSEPSRIALFIDGYNLQATARMLGFDIDYRRLLNEFESRGTLVRAFFYISVMENQERSSVRPLIDWLDYNGFKVVYRDSKGVHRIPAAAVRSRAIWISNSRSTRWSSPGVDQIVLFSGDGDFRRLVEAVQRRGAHVTVISTMSSQPPMVADELRRQADAFIDLVELQSRIVRDPS